MLFRFHISILCRSAEIKNTLIICAALFFFSQPAIAADETGQSRNVERKRIEQGIKKYRINIRRLQHGMRKQQELIRRTIEQERNLLAELEDIDSRLQEQKEKLAALEERMSAQQVLITVKEKELKRVQNDKETVQKHLQRRISAYYKMGRIGLINVTFSTETLPSLLKFHDSFNFLIDYDQSVINTYKHTINELSSTKDLLTLEKNLLKEFITQAKEEEARIDETKNEKLTLLEHIRNQTKLHKQAMKEMEKASAQLSDSLTVIQVKKKEFEKGFFRNKGKHLLPVDGEIIATYDSTVVNKIGISKINKGLDIAAENGTKVKAIYDGIIVYSGYLRGFGNTVIINHGYGYFSIVSRLGRLTRKKGQRADRGDVIGIADDTAMVMNDGIHFEIRQGSKELDPMQWIDQAKLSPPKSETILH